MKTQHFLTIASLAVSMTVMAQSASAFTIVYENDDPATGNVTEMYDLAVDGEITSFSVQFHHGDFLAAFGDPTATSPAWSGVFGKPYFWSTESNAQIEAARQSAFKGVNAIVDALNSVDEDGDGRSDISLLNYQEYALVPYTYKTDKGQIISRVAAFNQLDDGAWVPFITDVASGGISDEENYADFAPITPGGEGTPEPASLLGILAIGTSGFLLKNKRQRGGGDVG